MSQPSGPPRPAQVCRQLLLALEASEGRRRRRKRDTTPDAIGIGIKRWLLEETVRCDPGGEEFEAWLLERSRGGGGGVPPPGEAAPGAVLAMGRAVLDEWLLAAASPEFRAWLEQGAPSSDARGREV